MKRAQVPHGDQQMLLTYPDTACHFSGNQSELFQIRKTENDRIYVFCPFFTKHSRTVQIFGKVIDLVHCPFFVTAHCQIKSSLVKTFQK